MSPNPVLHNAANSIEDVEYLNDWQPQHYVLPLSEKQAVSFEGKMQNKAIEKQKILHKPLQGY